MYPLRVIAAAIVTISSVKIVGDVVVGGFEGALEGDSVVGECVAYVGATVGAVVVGAAVGAVVVGDIDGGETVGAEVEQSQMHSLEELHSADEELSVVLNIPLPSSKEQPAKNLELDRKADLSSLPDVSSATASCPCVPYVVPCPLSARASRPA